jgi:hypothetical protein
MEPDLSSIVKLAREKTMLGEYENACTLYQQSIAEINKTLMRAINN